MYGSGYGHEFMMGSFGTFDPFSLSVFGASISLILVWALFWKGVALWHAARRREPWWFIALLLINTMGLLEIVYLFLFAKIKIDELFGKRD